MHMTLLLSEASPLLLTFILMFLLLHYTECIFSHIHKALFSLPCCVFARYVTSYSNQKAEDSAVHLKCSWTMLQHPLTANALNLDDYHCQTFLRLHLLSQLQLIRVFHLLTEPHAFINTGASIYFSAVALVQKTHTITLQTVCTIMFSL